LNQEAWGDLEIVKDLVSQVLMGLLAKPDAKKELPTVIKQLKSKIGVSN